MTYPLNPDSFGKRKKVRRIVLPPPGLHLPVVDRLELHMPTVPPSVNSMYPSSGNGGRHKSAAYTAWVTATGWEMKPQFVGRVPGNVVLDMTFCRMSVAADVSNRIKSAEDFLVSHGLIDDDRFVQSITARWGGLSGATIVIERAA